jgi:hypothetical protein
VAHHDGLGHGECRGGGADADGERTHRDGGEAGGPPHLAAGITQIADEILDRAEREEVAAGVLEHGGVAELASREASCVARRDAFGQVLLLEEPEVKVQLGPRVAILLR